MADVLSHINQAVFVEESDIRWSQYDPAHNFISLVLFSLLSAVQFFSLCVFNYWKVRSADFKL